MLKNHHWKMYCSLIPQGCFLSFRFAPKVSGNGTFDQAGRRSSVVSLFFVMADWNALVFNGTSCGLMWEMYLLNVHLGKRTVGSPPEIFHPFEIRKNMDPVWQSLGQGDESCESSFSWSHLCGFSVGCDDWRAKKQIHLRDFHVSKMHF